MREIVQRNAWRLALPAIAVVFALAIGGLLISSLGVSPGEAAGTVIQAGFSCDPGYCNLGGTLSLAGPIIFCALGAVVSLRSGLFSIGQEGQYALGGLAAAVVGFAIPAPAGVHPVLCLAAAAIVGALWGVIPAILKVYLGVNELIITIVLNAMAGLLLDFLVNYPLRAEASTVGYTPSILPTARLALFDTSTKVGVGFVLAIIACVVVWFYMSRTTRGYEQRMSGEATLFARYAGMSASSSVLRAGLLGGALAGIGGGIQVLGANYRRRGVQRRHGPHGSDRRDPRWHDGDRRRHRRHPLRGGHGRGRQWLADHARSPTRDRLDGARSDDRARRGAGAAAHPHREGT